jgi:hypothetical protein
MSLKAFAIDTAKVAPLALGQLFWTHASDITKFCMLIYSAGLAVQTCYRLWSWLRRKFSRSPA